MAHDLRARLVDASQRAVEQVTDAFTPENPSLKPQARNARAAATVIAIVAVAGAFFTVAASVVTGGILSGLIGIAACALIAVTANDVRVIANKVANGGIMQGIKELSSDSSKADIWAAAAQRGTLILTPDMVRWTVEHLS